jgi:O-antigen/teichoic acid export membrane protein
VPRHRTTLRSISALALRGAGAVLQYAVTVLVARLTSPATVGAFSAFQAGSRVLTNAGSLGLPSATMRRAASLAGDDRRAAADVVATAVRFCAVVVAGLFALVALAFGVGRLSGAFDGDAFAIGLAYVAGGFGLSAIRVYADGVKGLHMTAAGVAVEFLPIPLVFAAAVVVVDLVRGTPSAAVVLWAYAAATAAIAVVVLALSFLLRSGPRRRLPLRPAERRSDLAALCTSSTVNVLLPAIPFGVLAIVGNQDDAGSFGVASRTAALATLLLFGLAATYAPRFARHHSVQEWVPLREAVVISARTSVLLYSPLFVVFIVFPSQVLVLFGPGFESAATVLRILAVGQLVNSATGLSSELLVMVGRERSELVVTAGAALGVGVLGLVLGAAWGVVGVSVAFAAGLGARNMACWLLGRRYLLRGPALDSQRAALELLASLEMIDGLDGGLSVEDVEGRRA